jgi:3-deoxy-D-manno-octulosonate 8-phosphate phosphatase (KDO 8-P phosphatase)
MQPPRGIISALQSVKLLSCDVDGVLTDGGLYYDEEGNEIRRFHVLDGIKHCYLGVKDKMDTMRQLLKDLNLDISEVAHIGDDLNDLELLLAVGLPITVPKAVKEVKEIARLITEKNGGEGAVREVTDKIISSKKNSN